MSTPEGRAAERHRRVLLSSLAAAAAKMISVGVALVSVPLTLHYLGPERYGMWMTMSSFIVMMSFADLGMGNGLLNVVAGANGRDDRAAIRGLVSSAVFILSGLALSLGIVTSLVYPLIPWPRLFNVDSALAAQEAGPAIAVLLACFLLAIPLGVVQKTQMGLQQGFAVSLWQCGASLFALGCLLLAIRLEGGLPWLVLALVGGPLVANASNAIMFFGMQARDLAPSAGLVSRRDMARIGHIGLLFLVLQIVIAVAFSSDNIVIAQLLGASSVAEYAVPAQMFSVVTTVLNMGLAPLWPAYGEALARGDLAWVKRTLVRSLVISISLAALASTALVFIGPHLLKLWVGKAIEPPYLLLLGLALWKSLEAAGNAVAMFLNGANVVKFQVVTAVLMGIAAITLKIGLVAKIGISGVPLATSAAYLALILVPTIFVIRGIIKADEHKLPGAFTSLSGEKRAHRAELYSKELPQ
jgi:O-antigen/teichoic acid export membrane protein